MKVFFSLVALATLSGTSASADAGARLKFARIAPECSHFEKNSLTHFDRQEFGTLEKVGACCSNKKIPGAFSYWAADLGGYFCARMAK